MKSYTDLEQSKKLVEILPLESADMGYLWNGVSFCEYPVSNQTIFKKVENIPCWSLAALLNLMICPRLEEYVKGIWDLTTFTDETLRTPIEIQDSKDPVDACVTMIEKLHELKML